MDTTTNQCATCNESHAALVRTMPDGSSHVYQDAATLARRKAATTAHKVRFNALYDAAHKAGTK